ncbi:hypothetical protein STEG23_006023 [Scotinomys teguina]
MLESITNELSLFSKTQGQQASSLRDLPTSPVDLVINRLDQPWHKAAMAWANQNRTPVLSIDPPGHEVEQGIDAKWSLVLGLPLPLGEHAGRVYLCDIGIPQQVFQEGSGQLDPVCPPRLCLEGSGQLDPVPLRSA